MNELQPVKKRGGQIGNKGGGRKSIADNDLFIETLFHVCKDVLKPSHLYMYQDRVLLGLINDHLKEHDLILNTTTYANWKRLWIDNRTDKFFTERPVLIEFFELLEKLMRDAEEYLLTKLESSAAGHWQKYAWILERRFDTWKLDTGKQAPIINVVQLKLDVPEGIDIISNERDMLNNYNRETNNLEEIDYE